MTSVAARLLPCVDSSKVAHPSSGQPCLNNKIIETVDNNQIREASRCFGDASAFSIIRLTTDHPFTQVERAQVKTSNMHGSKRSICRTTMPDLIGVFHRSFAL